MPSLKFWEKIAPMKNGVVKAASDEGLNGAKGGNGLTPPVPVNCDQGASSERVGEIAFAAGVPLHELVNDAGLLEDIFLELTAQAPA